MRQGGRALADILAARDHLIQCRSAPAVSASPASAWAASSRSSCPPKGFGASAPFYGTPLPRNLGETLEGACPIVASFGGRNPLGKGVPEKFREVTEAKQLKTGIKVYPGVGHSFANTLPAQPLLRITGFGYDRAATEDAWSRVFAFFGEHLAAGATT